MLEFLLLCKISLGYQTEWTFNFTGGVQYVYFYEGCAYNVQLWGANGGKGFVDGNSADGGVGAYIRGTIKLSNSHNMLIRVGEAGFDGWEWQGGSGGYNGGAKGGDDTGSDRDDAAGGGGGATDIGFTDDTRIAAAAGGSGAACGVMGAPGAGLNEHGDLESATNIIFGTEGGTGNRNGSPGLDHSYCPGSGGSGGWEGGVGNDYAYIYSFTAVAYSGSSGYLEKYMSQVTVKRGNDPTLPNKPSKNGYVIVKLTNPDDVTCQIPRPSPTASRSLSPSSSRSPWPTPTPVYTQRGDEKKAIKQKRGKLFDAVVHNSLYLVSF